jgi:hypothetical protein
MLDVHPPRHAASTWRDFFIHIATICVGLLIAIGLEQTVEALHHRHQRRHLEEQMRAESERNLGLVKAQLLYAMQMMRYLDKYQQAVEAAPLSGGLVTITQPVNDVSLPAAAGGMLVSPSRGTWTVAKSAGTVALLDPEKAKVYARLDLDAEWEQTSESNFGTKASLLKSSQIRARLPPNATTPVRIAAAERDNLLFAASEMREAMADFQFRLAILEGALEAVTHNISTLEEMYPYQQRTISSLTK